MKITQRDERAVHDRALEAEWKDETATRAARLPKGLRGLWHRLTGKYQEIRAANEQEATATKQRHADQRQTVIDRQIAERAKLQEEIKTARTRQAERLASLRRDLSHYRQYGGHKDRSFER